MKKFFHEDSPFDEFFRGANSYDKVISRFHNISGEEQSIFINFQKHRRSGLPKILKAEKRLTHNGNPNSQVKASSNPKQHDPHEVKNKEVEKKPEILSKNPTFTWIAIPSNRFEETFAMFESFMKNGNNLPQMNSNNETPSKNVTT